MEPATVEPTVEQTVEQTMEPATVEPTVEQTVKQTVEPATVEPTVEPPPKRQCREQHEIGKNTPFNMAYGSTPYVGMTPQKMVATIKVHK